MNIQTIGKIQLTIGIILICGLVFTAWSFKTLFDNEFNRRIPSTLSTSAINYAKESNDTNLMFLSAMYGELEIKNNIYYFLTIITIGIASSLIIFIQAISLILQGLANISKE